MTAASAMCPTTADLRAGLAVFGSADDLKVFKLQQPVPELLSVADRFQIKPLIRSVQRDARCQVLALTLADAKLYQGTRETLEPVDLWDAPTTIAEALGPELTEPYSQGDSGGRGGSAARRGSHRAAGRPHTLENRGGGHIQY